jgi:hypothetical protein
MSNHFGRARRRRFQKTSARSAQALKGKKHVVFLWGDSHASQLYYGLKKEMPSNWQVLIVASSMCLPVISTADSPAQYCGRSNWVAYNAIKNLRPDVVVVAQEIGHSVAVAESIGKAMKDAGVRRTIYVGPAPRWTGSLPDIVAQKFWDATPQRTALYNDPARKVENELLEQGLKASTTVEYFNLWKCFCDDGGCLVYLGDDRMLGLTSFDGHHLTDSASDYLAQGFLVSFIVGAGTPE